MTAKPRLILAALWALTAVALLNGCSHTAPAPEPAETAPSEASSKVEVPIERWQLDNGARVLYVHRPELPMMSLGIVFDAGSARDPEGQFGLSALTTRLLDEGAGELSADAFARRLDALGLRFGAGSGRDKLSLQVTSLTANGATAKGWHLLTEALTEPTFAKRAVERERRRLLTAIRQSRKKPRSVAMRAFYRQIYGNHPYAHPSAGTPEGLKAIERSDLQAFADRHLVGSNATIAVVGAMKRGEVDRLLERTVGRMPRGSKPPALPEVEPLDHPKEIFIRKEVSQAHLVMGQPGTRRGADDQFPLMVGNYTLGGGGFSSRLMSTIREQRGLSYSVYSRFSPMARRGPFAAGLQTANANAGEALSLLREEVAQFVAEGPTAEELEAAKRYLNGSFPLRVDSNQDLKGQIATIGFFGLGSDYLDRYRERVSAVQALEIRRAMQDRLDPGRMVTVIVGAQRPKGFGEKGPE